jgi:hypothetical protein
MDVTWEVVKLIQPESGLDWYRRAAMVLCTPW